MTKQNWRLNMDRSFMTKVFQKRSGLIGDNVIRPVLEFHATISDEELDNVKNLDELEKLANVKYDQFLSMLNLIEAKYFINGIPVSKEEFEKLEPTVERWMSEV